VLFLLNDAGGKLIVVHFDSVICGRSRVKAKPSMILEIAFILDIGLKLAGLLTSISVFLTSHHHHVSLLSTYTSDGRTFYMSAKNDKNNVQMTT
jgi:hypothetical protein